MLSIITPWLMLANFVLLAFWVLVDRRKLWIPLLALGLAVWSFGIVYQFEPNIGNMENQGIHIMTFNVRSFRDSRYVPRRDSDNRIAAFIAREDPDIVCLQEFSRIKQREFKQYAYQYTTPLFSEKSNQAILSRFPIVGQGEVRFPDTGNNTLYADILLGPDTVRVYNVHLQSYNIGSRRFLFRNFGVDFIRRMHATSKRHLQQARLVKEHLRSSPYPSILCGDLNATAYSHTYRILKRSMTDSFREKGSGWGTTFYLSGTYPFRIDFIMADPRFEVQEHRNYPDKLSDHLPVSAWLAPAGEHPAIDGIGKDVDQQGQPE
jgi:endonuclease/exonuclease/phosphatase family metal-dependent hydrolase